MTTENADPAPQRIVIDGIEGDLARVELPGGETEDWPLSRLPQGVREGDIVNLRLEDGELLAEIDREETEERRHEAQSLLDDLNAGGLEGDLEL